MTKPIFPDIPDQYTDRVQLTVTVFGVNITFGLGAPHPGQPNDSALVDVLDVVRVRMSLELAKAFTMLLRKNIKMYESQNNTAVALPDSIVKALGITEEFSTW